MGPPPMIATRVFVCLEFDWARDLSYLCTLLIVPRPSRLLLFHETIPSKHRFEVCSPICHSTHKLRELYLGRLREVVNTV